MPALVHRDTWHEVRPQGAWYELTGVWAGGGLTSLLRQLRQLLRHQVVVLGELLQQLMVRSRGCYAVACRSPGLLHGELLRRQLMREQLQHRRLLLRVAHLLPGA